MREYILMTDSCCDLPDQMARELQLEVLPLTMHMDGQDYPNTLDGAAISNEEFYRRIRAGKMATTSAVNVGQFEDAMSAVLAGGRDILCICFSSALSTTYQSACIAADLYAASGAAGGGAFFVGQVSGAAAYAENGQGRDHAPMAQGGGPAAQVQGQALRHGSAAQQGRHGGSPHSYSPEKRRMSRETGA